MPASEYRALQAQVSELQQLLGKKTMEAEILREAVSGAAGPKECMVRPRLASVRCGGQTGADHPTTAGALDLVAGGQSVTAIANVIGCITDRPPEATRTAPRCLTSSWSPICRPTVIAASMRCCAAQPSRPGAQRPTQSASIAS